MRIQYVTLDTPVGPVAVAWKGGAIVAVQMEETKDRMGWGNRYRTTSPEKRLRQMAKDGDEPSILREIEKVLPAAT